VAVNQRLEFGWKHSFSIAIDSGLKIPDAIIFQKRASGVAMKFVLQPWQVLLFILAGWINKQQQNAIDYLIMENRILREKLGKKRILLTDDQRRRLAIKGGCGTSDFLDLAGFSYIETIAYSNRKHPVKVMVPLPW